MGLGRLALDDLVASAPAIVPVRLAGYDHFVVLRGAPGGGVLLADPADGARTMSRARFERAWPDYPGYGKAALVAARRDGAAPPNRLGPRPGDFLVPR